MYQPIRDELILKFVQTLYSQSHLYGEAHQLLRGTLFSISSSHGTPPFIGALHALPCPIVSLEQRAWKRSICPEYMVPPQSPNVPFTEKNKNTIADYLLQRCIMVDNLTYQAMSEVT